MLVLSRREGEVVRVGEIEVMVLRAENGKVKLGFDGDPAVPIHRSELVTSPQHPEPELVGSSVSTP